MNTSSKEFKVNGQKVSFIYYALDISFVKELYNCIFALFKDAKSQSFFYVVCRINSGFVVFNKLKISRIIVLTKNSYFFKNDT